MAHTSTYLNFPRNTEEAFMFYKSVFGGEFTGDIKRFSEVPLPEGQPPMAEEDKNLVMHIALPITGGHMLLGTDAPESRGFTVTQGNNVYICLNPDTKEEGERLFTELSQDGKIEMEFQKMFWGDYFASFTDKFGIQWMIDVPEQKV